jgi:CheY-like chemotaxis protein
MRILVVEDHLDTANVMCRLLVRDGHDCHCAGTAAEALALVAADDFDLVIMDIGLPDTDGWDLLPRLRKGRALKALAVSGYAAVVDVERSRAAGFDAHLSKPVEFGELRGAIRELAARHRTTTKCR